MAEIDYKALLIKYMAWVGFQEGTYFLPYGGEFSEAEGDALRALTTQADLLRFTD